MQSSFRYATTSGNYKFVARIIGYLLLAQALIMLIPALVAVLYREEDFISFLISSAAAAGVGGGLLFLTRHGHASTLYRREGYLLTALAWILFSCFGMIPYMLAPTPLSAGSAFFETMSGFTTTGASMIKDVENQTHALLLWRAMTQWIGGLGIVLFMLALLPSLNKEGSLPMFNAEITGVTHDKIHPRIRQTAATLWKVYTSLTILLIMLLWAGPMDLFEAVCQSLTTLSTGGFSTRSASIAAWNSDYIAVVLTIFMFASGVNFIIIYNAAKGHLRQVWKSDVLRAYVLLVVVFAVAIMISIALTSSPASVASSVIQVLFTVTSAITSTGFSYGNYELWGPLVYMLLVAMVLLGACAGSTTGGFKIDRALIMWKETRSQCRHTIYPNHLESTRIGARVVSSSMIARIAAFAFIYIFLTAAGTMLLTLYGINPDDAFFATASCIGNSGLGYGLTGSEGGFFMLPEASKWVLSAVMLTGRLEVFTITALFFHDFWRR